jgi:hypothetical protein
MMPDVSFICTSDRPNHLRHLIACLRVQTNANWELIVLDQTPRAACLPPVTEVEALGETRVFYEHVPRVGDFGQSMKMAYTRFARGEFVCLPNDDAYYVPSFIDQMLWTARSCKYDLVTCGWLWSSADNTTPYRPMAGEPRFGHIDIGGYIMKREALIADGWTVTGEGGDGYLAERIAARVPHGPVPAGHILYVHN